MGRPFPSFRTARVVPAFDMAGKQFTLSAEFRYPYFFLHVKHKSEPLARTHTHTQHYGAETWALRKVDLEYWKVLKCGAVEGWRR
jgi:hypothetical protein